MNNNQENAIHPASDYEEYIWLLQQQNPDRILKYISGWQIDNPENITRWFDAIHNLIAAIPVLNARYNLNNEGELIKSAGEEWYSCVELISVNSPEEMVEKILTQQRTVWESERAPPFKALIVKYRDSVILALIIHEILTPIANERELMRALLQAYSGERPAPFTLQHLPILPCEEPCISPVPGLRTHGERAIIDTCVGTATGRRDNALAMRWKTTLRFDELQALPDCDGRTHDAILAGVTIRFIQFIHRSGGENSLALCLVCQDGLRRGLIDAADNESHLMTAILDKLNSRPDPADTALCAADNLWIYIRVLSHADDFAEKRIFAGQPVLLPTYQQHPDIELALDVNREEGVTLILTTGQAVFPSPGEFLLDRFVSFLKGHSKATAHFLTDSSGASPDAKAADEDNAIAAIILSAFRAILAVPDLSLTDDFFDHGGHSLLAMRVIGQLLSEHGLEVHFDDFFRYSSAITLAEHALPTHQPVSKALIPQQSGVTAPLALAQASLWKAYEACQFGTLFNLPFALDLIDAIDETLLEQALTDLLVRHPSLRTLFYMKNGEACQQVIATERLADYQWFWGQSKSQGVSLRDEAAYRFDLAQELPVRFRLLHNPATGRQALSFLVHHMAIDEWSLNTMMEALSHAYAARAAGKNIVWQKNAPPFHAFARRQQAEGVNQQHLAFWTNMLRGATRGLALFDSERPPHHENTPQAAWTTYCPQPDITRQLYAIARQNSTSLFCVFYAAIALALHKLGDLNEIAIGTSAPGRFDPDTYETVGYFTIMLAHRVQFEREKPVQALITTVRDTINHSIPYASVPLDIIQQSLGIPQQEGLMFDVYIQIHANNALNGTFDLMNGNGIRYRQIDADKTESMFGLQFEIVEDIIEGEKTLRLIITWRTGRYTEQQVQRISAAIDRLLTLFATATSLEMPLKQIAL